MSFKHAIILACIALLISACTGVNQSIQVDDGTRMDGGLSTVNGAIRIGADCEIGGQVSNVNGSIQVGANSQIAGAKNVNGSISLGNGSHSGDIRTTNGSLTFGDDVVINGNASTTNGRIRGGERVRVNGNLSAVNGTLNLASGSHVEEKVSTVNGSIALVNSRAGELETTAGSISLLEGSVIDGDLRVRKPSSGSNRETPTIIIGKNSKVGGKLEFEREVELRIHESAETGEISGATPTFFSD